MTKQLFQTPHLRNPNRADHVWLYYIDRNRWKCVLCGAICVHPPKYPTPPDWMPDRYEKLTEEEQVMCVDRAP